MCSARRLRLSTSEIPDVTASMPSLTSHELVSSDIYSSDGVNKFAKRGLSVPVIFDDSDEFRYSMREVLKQSFAGTFFIYKVILTKKKRKNALFSSICRLISS